MNQYRYFLLLWFLVSYSSFSQHQKQWIEDIDYYYTTLEQKHIDLYHTISKNEFTAELENLKTKIPNLSDFEIIVELMRITQKVGGGKSDGHTSVPLWGTPILKFPIELIDFDGEMKVIAIAAEFQNYLGHNLMAINDIPIEVITRKVSEITPFTENKYSSMDRTCSYMVISEILQALQITENSEEITFTFSNNSGVVEVVTLKALSKEELASLAFKKLSISHPLVSKPIKTRFKNLWFYPIQDSKIVYIHFEQYPSEIEIKEFAEQVYDYIEKQKSEALIIDFRGNYGGDFYKGLVLSAYLNASEYIDWKSKVYVLVNRKTYSAAMVNALQYKQLLNATIVGEGMGANPNGYQDMGQFYLPNSNLLITYSKRKFQLQTAIAARFQPDILIAPQGEDYETGIDQTLQWVLDDLRLK
ncbi:S41 family peptidase [Ulvibacter litoralis]|uniref:Peptidase family S41 n=1 Tax=Ulvibacter litoralis TaxID=227084 RepID=A0A1G7FLS9_9FLAO|nr:S41 family peptidase [Ulvibacter litoralis]GHC50631.1 hypothetical protein GCM10008083_12740 [Ulvibacter litoralis]SDE76833.1 Peptidase family S41 [Ulvibacter litoralis]